MRYVYLFLGFVLIVVVLAVVGAWQLNWWQVSSIPSDTTGKTGVRLTMDKEKMKQDVDAAEGKVKEEVRALKDGVHKEEKAPLPGQSVTGTIHKIDLTGHSLTVMSDKNEEVTMHTDAATKVRIGEKDGTLADLQVGDGATVTSESARGEQVAKMVIVKKKS